MPDPQQPTRCDAPGTNRRVAYFSMEIALEPRMPTYTGGLGVLAGDTLRSAADLEVPIVAVTLLTRQGYISQKLDADGWQTEEPVRWKVEDFVTELPARVSVTIEGRTVHLRAWLFEVKGITGYTIPVYLLDADLQENTDADRALTAMLYGGDSRYRLCQEVILGIGGLRMLRALGHDRVERFHMNEGHAALLTLELLDERARAEGRQEITDADVEAVRDRCVFTTHTPVPAGHDRFPVSLVRQVLGDHPALRKSSVFCCDDMLNMTYLALNTSRYVNAVAAKHGEVSRAMFPQYHIESITNGVHVGTWTSKPIAELFDRYLSGWRNDSFLLRGALGIPGPELWAAHQRAKHQLVEHINARSEAGLDPEMFTIGFARRATGYKRADLLVRDIDRVKRIAAQAGRLQIVYAGKSHAKDTEGKELIHRVVEAAKKLRPEVAVVYLENYDMALASLLVAGVDLWVNTPQPPLEASGTSGMKAAINGVPSLSVLDGWWIEGHIEGVTGWAIGAPGKTVDDARDDARDMGILHDQLERVIIPMYYNRPEQFIDVMRHAIAINGTFFNTQRMVEQYALHAYFCQTR